MTDLLIGLVAMLPMLLIMALNGGPPAADPKEESVRESLRSALGKLVSSGFSETRIVRLAADELDDLRLLTKGAN